MSLELKVKDLSRKGRQVTWSSKSTLLCHMLVPRELTLSQAYIQIARRNDENKIRVTQLPPCP